MYRSARLATIAVSLTALLSACVGNPAKLPEPTAKNNEDYYELHRDGGVIAFADADSYISVRKGASLSNSKSIEVDSVEVTIPAGGNNAEALMLYKGELTGADDFYAEVDDGNRIHVFSRWQDLRDFKAAGESAYRYTDIGAGPEGQTVVYVMTPDSRWERPEQLIARFRALHKMTP